MQLDHIVILVYDLDRAIQDYTDLGFTVVEGGEHADGKSRNALIAFEDGSYLELIAFLREPPPDHMFARGAELGEGIIHFALLPHNITTEVARIRQAGLHMHGPKNGGRVRPDGVELEWQTAWSDDPALPFLCADVTSRDLRVAFGPARLHSNGAKGVTSLVILADNLEEVAQHYSALLGAGAGAEGGTTFRVGGSTVHIVKPESAEDESYFKQRGHGLARFTLAATHGPSDRANPLSAFDRGKTHRVTIETEKPSTYKG